MRTKQEIQTVIAALVMAANTAPEGTTMENKSNVRAAYDVLLWVMGYPCAFNDVASEIIDKFPLQGKELEELFENAIANLNKIKSQSHSE